MYSECYLILISPTINVKYGILFISDLHSYPMFQCLVTWHHPLSKCSLEEWILFVKFSNNFFSTFKLYMKMKQSAWGEASTGLIKVATLSAFPDCPSIYRKFFPPPATESGQSSELCSAKHWQKVQIFALSLLIKVSN